MALVTLTQRGNALDVVIALGEGEQVRTDGLGAWCHRGDGSGKMKPHIAHNWRGETLLTVALEDAARVEGNVRRCLVQAGCDLTVERKVDSDDPTE